MRTIYNIWPSLLRTKWFLQAPFAKPRLENHVTWILQIYFPQTIFPKTPKKADPSGYRNGSKLTLAWFFCSSWRGRHCDISARLVCKSLRVFPGTMGTRKQMHPSFWSWLPILDESVPGTTGTRRQHATFPACWSISHRGASHWRTRRFGWLTGVDVINTVIITIIYSIAFCWGVCKLCV